MIPGETISLGGKEWIVPSLTFKQVREMTESGTIDKVPANGLTCIAQPDTMRAAEDVLFAALSRNYPDLKRDQMDGLLDLANVKTAVDAVMGISGFKLKPKEEAKPGEAPSPWTP